MAIVKEATSNRYTIPAAWRPLIGLLGVFLAVMMVVINSRVVALGIVDIRGVYGFESDDMSWLSTVSNVGELIAMPLAVWCAITFSIRRFAVWMISGFIAIAFLLPFIQQFYLLLTLRLLQTFFGGALIPILMMAGLRFLPANHRLYGLAIYSMIATFAPNLTLFWLGFWLDEIDHWRGLFWQVIPVSLLALFLIRWGMPDNPIDSSRFRTGNWFGITLGTIGLICIVITLDQGVRLDWYQSRLITWTTIAGISLIITYLITEWFHPTPFLKVQLLGRRNVGLGAFIFVLILIVLPSGSALPANFLGQIAGYRAEQSAPAALIISLSQFALAPLVTFLLYQKWVDARVVISLGLICIAVSCFMGSKLTPDWIRTQFYLIQSLQAIGQPMAFVASLFIGVSSIKPEEGPFLAGMMNTLRVLGTLIGATAVGQMSTNRAYFHRELLLDYSARVSHTLSTSPNALQLQNAIAEQAYVMAVADSYLVFGLLSVLIIPFVFLLKPISGRN